MGMWSALDSRLMVLAGRLGEGLRLTPGGNGAVRCFAARDGLLVCRLGMPEAFRFRVGRLRREDWMLLVGAGVEWWQSEATMGFVVDRTGPWLSGVRRRVEAEIERAQRSPLDDLPGFSGCDWVALANPLAVELRFLIEAEGDRDGGIDSWPRSSRVGFRRRAVQDDGGAVGGGAGAGLR